MSTRKCSTHAIFYLLLLITVAVNATSSLEIHDAWVREAPPTVKIMAAYFTLQNHSSKTYTLTSLSSPDFSKVEIHHTEQHNGMNKMVPVAQVILSPNGSVNFQPGNMHLMLINPNNRFTAGDNIRLTLSFAGEHSMQISLPVKKAMAKSDHNKHSDSHSH